LQKEVTSLPLLQMEQRLQKMLLLDKLTINVH
jgi:hypothetical protein